MGYSTCSQGADDTLDKEEKAVNTSACSSPVTCQALPATASVPRSLVGQMLLPTPVGKMKVQRPPNPPMKQRLGSNLELRVRSPDGTRLHVADPGGEAKGNRAVREKVTACLRAKARGRAASWLGAPVPERQEGLHTQRK